MKLQQPTVGGGQLVGTLPQAAPTPTVPAPLPPAPNRLHFIDALRGLAALSVFGFHLSPYCGPLLFFVAGKGWVGVEVFFVLSGFVIAHTVGDARITPSFFGSFVLRRSLRLDPPYWIVIALTLALIPLANRLFPDRPLVFPSPTCLLAHVFYAQHLAGFPDIVDVFWSLCIEVQLYLVYVLALGVVQAVTASSRYLTRYTTAIAFLLFTGLAALSLVGELGWLTWEKKTWFLSYWHEFFFGVLVSWVLRRKLPASALWLYVTLVGLTIAWSGGNFALAVTAATGLLLYAVGVGGWLRDGLNVWGLQLLGRVSYGFYLIHTLVLARTDRLLTRLGYAPADYLPLVAVTGFALSFAAAYLLYRFVETPCVRFGKRFKVA